MNNKEIMEKISELEQQIAELKEAAQKQDEPKAWLPEFGENYWYVDDNGKTYCICYGAGFLFDPTSCEIGNCFPTKERAEEVAKKFRMLLKLECYRDMFCPDYVPDWENNQRKYCVFFNTHDHRWDYDLTTYFKDAAQVYFDSEETAQKVRDLLNQEEKENG